MNSKIDISFCIPVYNTQAYIDQCITSILSQNMERYSFEIICVDDGSSDGSVEYLQEKYALIQCVQVFAKDAGKGVSHVRNRLMSLAKGEYIWFVDSDDCLINNSVKILLDIANSENADVVLANYIKVDESHRGVEYVPEKTYSYQPVDMEGTLLWLPNAETGEAKMLSVCRGIFRRDFLNKASIKFDERISIKEDVLFYYHLRLASPKTIKCEVDCYCVRQRMGSAMRCSGEEKRKRVITSSRALVEEYQKMICGGFFADELRLMITDEKKIIVDNLLRLNNTKYLWQKFEELCGLGWYPIMESTSFVYKSRLVFWMTHFVYMLVQKVKTKG